MPTLKDLDNEVTKLTDTGVESSSGDSSTIDNSFKGRAMACLKPPYVYFIVLFFVVLGGLYYTRPCYVLSKTIDPKTNKQTLDYKMLMIYTVAISGLVGLAAYPYLAKK